MSLSFFKHFGNDFMPCKNNVLRASEMTVKMGVGSCRMSTDVHNPDWQLAALKRARCKRIGTDKARGAHVKR